MVDDDGDRPSGDGARPASSPPATEDTAPRLPLSALIPRGAWKLWGVVVLGFLFLGGLLAAGSVGPADTGVFGPAWSRVFRLPSGPAVRWFGSLLLALSGQLALLVGWVRAQSPRDFAGGYRIWTRSAVVAGGCAVLLGMRVDLVLSETVVRLSGTGWSSAPALAWWIPVAGCVALVLPSLHKEMQGCRTSLSLLWLAIFGWLIASGTTLVELSAPSMGTLLHSGAALTGHLLFLAAVLFHARHVVYVTADPPVSRRGDREPEGDFPRLPRLFRLKADGRWAPWRFLKRTRQSSGTLERREDQSVSPTPNAGKPASEAVGPPSQDSGQTVSRANPSRPRPAGSAPPGKQTSKTGGDKRGQKEDPPPQAEAFPDPERLKGLSKKQRKKLRKQWREQQRQAQKRP